MHAPCVSDLLLLLRIHTDPTGIPLLIAVITAATTHNTDRKL